MEETRPFLQYFPFIEELKKEIVKAIQQGVPFGPAEATEPPARVPAPLVSELLRGSPSEFGGGDLLWLRNLVVDSALDLEAKSVDMRARFDGCVFEEQINLFQTCGLEFNFFGCKLEKGLSAAQLRLRWNLRLDRSRSRAEMLLSGAKIGGQCSWNGFTAGESGKAGVCILAEGISVAQGFFCREDFKAFGEIRLVSGNIGGQLAMNGASIEAAVREDGSRGTALMADRISVKQGVYCADGFKALGSVRFPGAVVGGQFSLRGATLDSSNAGEGLSPVALAADGIEVKGSLIGDELEARGEVRLQGAAFGGQVSFNDALLEGGEGTSADALGADRASIDAGLFCKNLKAVGGLHLSGINIGGQLVLLDAELEGTADPNGAVFPAATLDGAVISGGAHLDRCAAVGEIRLLGADLSGQLSVVGAVLEGGVAPDGTTDALSVDRARIGGDFFCGGLTTNGELRILGAEIAGQVTMERAVLMSTNRVDDSALSGDGCEIAGGLFAEEIFCEGEVRFPGARIGTHLSFTHAAVAAIPRDDGSLSLAFRFDGAELTRGAFFDHLEARGELRFIGAKVNGQLSFVGARLEAHPLEGEPVDVLSLDRIEVAGGMFCADLVAAGPVRLPGAKIHGQLLMGGAVLNGTPDPQQGGRPALFAVNAELEGGFYLALVEAIGEISIAGAKVEGQLVFSGATLKALPEAPLRPVLNADGAVVTSSVYGEKVSAAGEIRFSGLTVGGRLVMDGSTLSGAKDGELYASAAFTGDGMQARGIYCRAGFSVAGQMRLPGVRVEEQFWIHGAILKAEDGENACLNLIAAHVDELVLALVETDGAVDLRDASVRSLWDAEDGDFEGQLPRAMRLEGFSYQSLREPLDAKRRLSWIASSQRDRHYPGVYRELAESFRRIGRAGEARKIAIANERRARRDMRSWGVRRAWSDFLWVTIGYGYRNGLAALWLVGLIGVGALLFSLDESSFLETARHPPHFNPVLYAIDVTVPVLDLGQAHGRSATGWLAWVSLCLAVSGYALAAAVIAAAAGVFNRDEG